MIKKNGFGLFMGKVSKYSVPSVCLWLLKNMLLLFFVFLFCLFLYYIVVLNPFAYWKNLHAFLSSADYFPNFFQEYHQSAKLLENPRLSRNQSQWLQAEVHLQQIKWVTLFIDETSRVKSGIFGQTAKFGQPLCLFYSSIIGIKNKLTKQTVKILMRRLIRSRLIWISIVCKCGS